MHTQDRIFFRIINLVALTAPLVLVSLFILLGLHSRAVFHTFGFDFLVIEEWNPMMGHFGALPFIKGTLMTAILALIISVPFCVAASLSVNLLLPKKIAVTLRSLFDVLASIPSIIFGQWALLVIVPFVRDNLSPYLQAHPLLGGLAIFEGAAYGLSVLTAALVLALMIAPLITSLLTEIFKLVPVIQKQGFLSLGTTYWEMIVHVYLRPNVKGIMASSSLGLSRALGETMAMAMVIGNFPNLSWSVLAPSATISSVLANEYAEVTDPLHLSALVALALILFVMTFFLNLMARAVLKMRGE